MLTANPRLTAAIARPIIWNLAGVSLEAEARRPDLPDNFDTVNDNHTLYSLGESSVKEVYLGELEGEFYRKNAERCWR